MVTKRQKKPKSDTAKHLKAVRSKLPTSIIEFELDTIDHGVKDFEDTLEHGRIIRNTALGQVYKSYQQMVRTKQYRQLLKAYGEASQKDQANKKKEIGVQLDRIQQTYGVTFERVSKDAEILQKRFSKAQAVIAQTTAECVWNSMEGLLYRNAEKPSFKRKGEWNSFRGKQNERCLMLKQDKEGTFFIKYQNKKYPLIVKKNDLFAHETLSHIANYFQNGDDIDRQNIERHLLEKPLQDTYRVKYNRIIRKEIRGKYRYFVQIVVEGKPVVKRKKDGTFRHKLGKGPVGIDVGTQSVAATSKQAVVLKNLADRTNEKREKKIISLQKQQNRSRRLTNPNNYQADGQIRRMKKGETREWHKSKRYQKRQQKLRNLQRIQAENRQYAHNQDINYLRSLGDVFITETNTVKAWMKRAKETTLNQKTGKINRKKRFGKSILNRSPGAFLAQAKYRFEITGGSYREVNTWTFKASQYDHTLNDSNKKQLSQRWHTFPNGVKVQRDLYASFLLYCSEDDYQQPNQQRCLTEFERFMDSHDACIQEIQKRHLRICNSGIKLS